jgi:lysine 2,3-aminomutase
MLKKYHPIFINTHFNHPREVTAQSKEACERLANAGIPLGCQTVLMKGVNDDPAVLKELMQAAHDACAYYLYQASHGDNHPDACERAEALATQRVWCPSLSSTLRAEEERSP